MFNFLKTDRTKIRKFKLTDKEKLIELLCNPAVTKNMAFPEEILNENGVSNLLEMTIKSYDSKDPLLSFAIQESESKKFIGVCGFKPLAENGLEVFYAFLPEFWGKGFASEILSILTNYAFLETNSKVLIAPITQKNLASRRVAEKNGYINCGIKEDPNYRDLIFIYKKEKNNI